MAVMVYRYAVQGRIPQAVTDEIRRGHILRNKITEIYRDADTHTAGLYADQPDVAGAQQAADRAAEQVQTLTGQIQARKSAQRRRQPDSELAQRVAEARAVSRGAQARLKSAQVGARRRLLEQERRILAGAHAAVDALCAQAAAGSLYADSPVPGALYWASRNTIARQQRTALDGVISRRSEGRPAELAYRRWDGTGTLTVTLQREIGVTPQERAEVTRLRADGLSPRQIAERTRFSARTVARIRDTGPERAGDPPRTPAVLADTEHGRWRNVLALTPGRTEAEWAALPPAQRKRAEVRFRIGAGPSAAMATLWIVLHQPLPDNADVIQMQVTITRATSTRVKASIALTVNVPDPEPPEPGGPAAVHTGWRVLDDGAIRVAVITGAPPPPPGIGAVRDERAARMRWQARRAGTRSGIPGRPWAGATASDQESGLRDHGSWQEIVILPAIRRRDEHVRSLLSIRGRETEQARKAIAEHIARHLASRELLDPDGTLDRWRSRRRFTRAIGALESACPSPAGEEAAVAASPADLDAEGAIAAGYIEGLLGIAGLDGDIDAVVDGGRTIVSVAGPARDVLTGADSDAARGLQELTRLAVHRRTGVPTRLIVDVGGYRARHASRLAPAAQTAARPGDPEPRDPADPVACGTDHDALLAALQAWQEQDQHLESWQLYEQRRHVIGWRRSMYRSIADWLTGSASVVIMDSWSAARARPAADEEDTWQMQASRANAVLAAPGELRQAIREAARRRGVPVQEGPGRTSTAHQACPAGNGELPAGERASSLVVTCRGCGHLVDQDLNALAVMIASGMPASRSRP